MCIGRWVLEADGLTFHYGSRLVLNSLRLRIPGRKIFALLGPNGSGKSTLFRILSTLVPPQQGSARVYGYDIHRNLQEIRERIGIVFQSPALDRKLTVYENLRFQAAMYGLSRATLAARSKYLLERFGVSDRRDDYVESLSGGLRRRVELVKGLLHRPQLLLLDEPSSGLDPKARLDLWNHLQQLTSQDGVTVFLTTHLLEEAERADRVGILDRGTLIAEDAPDTLRAELGDRAVEIESESPDELAQSIRDQLGINAHVVARMVRLDQNDSASRVAELLEAFPQQIRGIRIHRPTLEDVFVTRTGHRLEPLSHD